jgi:Cu(I)/Ag(I) efflux system membrane fusion protein
MTFDTISRAQLAIAAAVLAIAAGGLGYGLASWRHEDPPAATPGERKILYWYDPMVPSQHFDKPGKSPFMDMELVPKYADEAASGEAGVSIDPARAQSLGLRIAEARTGTLGSALTATGTIEFNERDVAIVQARTGGFVQRVYALAPGDMIGKGAPLADILVPEWAGAQTEYLAVRRIGDAGLSRAARQRLLLLGMSSWIAGWSRTSTCIGTRRRTARPSRTRMSCWRCATWGRRGSGRRTGTGTAPSC